MFGYWFDFDLTTTTIIFSFRTNDKLNSFCTPYSFILQYFLDIKPTKWSQMNNKELIDSNAWLPLVAENCSPGVESDSNKKQKRKNNETILGLDYIESGVEKWILFRFRLQTWLSLLAFLSPSSAAGFCFSDRVWRQTKSKT